MADVARLPRFDLKETFLSLRYPNYRLWFIGQLVSLVGTWMQSAAQGYLIYELTQSPAYLGYVSFASGLPSWIFTLYAGAIADRIPRRTLLIITQTAMMILAFVLAALTFTNLVQPWHIIVLAFLLGIANAFDAPARQAFVVELVDREVLTNAIAVNSTMFTSAIVVGPAVGGLAYAAVGPEWCFVLNGISFLAVIAALLMMKLTPVQRTPRKATAWREIMDGLRYVWRDDRLRMLISNIGITTLFGMSMATLIPLWAVDILGGDAKTNGFLLSACGLGSLLGALMIASMSRRQFRGQDVDHCQLCAAADDDRLRRGAFRTAGTANHGGQWLGLYLAEQHHQCHGAVTSTRRATRAGNGDLYTGLLWLVSDRFPGCRKPGRPGKCADHVDHLRSHPFTVCRVRLLA